MWKRIAGRLEDYSVIVPIYKRKGDVTNCGAYRRVKLLKNEMKIVERVLEKNIRVLMKVDNIQFGFMPERRTTDAPFIVKRMQEEYREKDKKLLMSFVDLAKASKKSNAIGTEEERTIRDLSESGDESL